jgi:hypothetical protein
MTDKPVVSNFSIDPTEESRLSPPRLAMHIAWQSKKNGTDIHGALDCKKLDTVTYST